MIFKFTFYIFAFIFLLNNNSAIALFLNSTRENRPIFQDEQDYAVYFSVSGGFMMTSFLSNIDTLNLSDSGEAKSIQNAIGDSSSKNLKGKYAPYLNIAIGYKSLESIVRHEIEFTYLQAVSSTISDLSQNTGVDLNNNAVSFLGYDNRRLLSIGSYMQFFQLMYKPYLHFDDAFSIFGENFDFFVGGGFGFTVVEGGIYAGSEYQKDSSGAWTSNIDSNGVSNYSSGSGKSVVKMKPSFAISCEISTGVVYNITSVVAMQLKTKYAFISRPVFGVDFSSVKTTTNSNSHLLHFFGLELTLLMKAF